MGMNDRQVLDETHEKKIPFEVGDVVFVEIKEGRKKHLRCGKIDAGKTSGLWRVFFPNTFVGQKRGTHGWYNESVMFHDENKWYTR